MVLAETGGQRLYLPIETADMEWGDMPVSIPGTRDWGAQRHSGSQSYVMRSVTLDGA